MDTKKQKVIKILKRIGIALSIGFNVLFLIAIIIGSSGIKNKSNNVQVACAESEIIKVDSQVNKKFVSYDDSNNSITLSIEDLNNTTWTNFITYINSLTESNINLGSSTYLSSSLSFTSYYNSGNRYTYLLMSPGSGRYIYFNNGNDGLWTISYSGSDNTFTDSLILTFTSSTYYEGFKNAIQLDIPSDEGNINDGIFETLTSGVVAFIGSIGSGITAMTSVFYDSANSQLTTIGLLSVIVVAVSLAYFLFRLIIGLIRMRG